MTNIRYACGAMWFHYFLLLPIVHLVESHVCKVEPVHPVDDFTRVVRLGGLLQDPHHLQSSSSLVKKEETTSEISSVIRLAR